MEINFTEAQADDYKVVGTEITNPGRHAAITIELKNPPTDIQTALRTISRAAAIDFAVTEGRKLPGFSLANYERATGSVPIDAEGQATMDPKKLVNYQRVIYLMVQPV